MSVGTTRIDIPSSQNLMPEWAKDGKDRFFIDFPVLIFEID